jgi:hypothetical protein
MAEELRALLPLVEEVRPRTVGARTFHVGRLAGTPVVLVLAARRQGRRGDHRHAC